MSLFTLSGGLVYHARAARYAASSWAPFRAQIGHFLRTRLAPQEELLLIGPSGGHCLPRAWLRDFGRLTLLEPDPLARLIFGMRVGSGPHEHEPRDLLLEPLLTGRAGLDAVLARRPRAAVLFCNVLGQLHFGLSDEEHARFQSEFVRRIVPALAGHAWASFHDRWSLDAAPDVALPDRLDFVQQPTDEELGVACFGAAGAPLTVLDHGTAALFPAELPRRYLGWPLTPRALHIVEAVSGEGA